ncbi:MAG: purine-binding chemotaxis protein CheW [Spirochaetes bacterium]|nr:purine-binding chemotaxis protein CheW [Spirochaetota bacterium]
MISETSANQSEEYQLILFELGNSLYGIPIDKVSEINRIDQITTLPKAPKFVEGVINLRGNVVPLIDLRKRFGMKQIERTKKNKIVVVIVEKRLFGIIVDSVLEVVSIARENIEPSLPTTSGLKTEFINSIGKIQDSLVIILDIENIIQSKEEIKLEE